MKARLLNLILLVGSVAVMLGLLELPAALGLVDYRSVFRSGPALATGKPWQNPHNRTDDELLWIHRPGQRITGSASGDMVAWLEIATDRRYPVDLTYDRNGFRNATDLDSAPVVLVGDSFLEWSNVGQQDLVGNVLERRLGVPVANLGQAGYGPGQERIVLRRYALPLRPRVVVWQFFEGNDLGDLQRYEEWSADWPRIRADMGGFAERSFLRNGWRTARLMAVARRETDGPRARERSCRITAGEARDSTLYFAYAGTPLGERELGLLTKVEQLLAEGQAEARQHGAELVLMFVPTKFRVYGDLCSYPPDGLAKLWVVNDMPQRLGAFAARTGMPFLDLTPALIGARNGPLLYFIDDGHWTPLGHQVAGDTLAAFLHANGLD
jgi:hypothetical protein